MNSQAILVTGASRGIGQAICEQLSSKFSTLLVLGRSEADLNKLKDQLSSRCQVVVFVTDFEQTQSIKNTLMLIHNYLDQSKTFLKGIINNAGIFLPQKSLEQRFDLWTLQMQVNLLAHVQITEFLIPFLHKNQEQTWIVNISSTLGIQAVAGTSAYGASKAAMIHWTKILALELAPKTRVNAICPGVVDTSIHSFHHVPQEQKKSIVDEWKQKHPLNRIGTPQDIAQACEFLTHDEKANWITGVILEVDGGIHLT